MQPVKIGKMTIDANSRPLLIAGPCVIEGEADTVKLAEQIAALGATKNYSFVFKASYLKDNRSSSKSYRGPGLVEGLRILKKVKDVVGCPVYQVARLTELVAELEQLLSKEEAQATQADSLLDLAKQVLAGEGVVEFHAPEE